MIDMRSHLHDSMAQSHVLRTRGTRRKKYLRRRGMRILLEEVMLGRPDIVEPDSIREFHLLERILQQLVLGLRSPRTRQLMFIKSANLHSRSLAFLLRKSIQLITLEYASETRLPFGAHPI